jgi:hypothetical protein
LIPKNICILIFINGSELQGKAILQTNKKLKNYQKHNVFLLFLWE